MERFDQPLGALPVIPVQWPDEDTQKKFEEYIKSEVEQSLIDRRQFDDACEEWQKQYMARLNRKDAGPDDSDIDMPLTTKVLRQNMARVINPLFQGRKVYAIETTQKAGYRDVAAYERALDEIIERRRAQHRKFCAKYYLTSNIYGIAVCKLGWTNEYEKILQWRTADAQLQMDELGNVVAIDKQQALVEERVLVNSGCFPQLVPIQDFLFPWYATDQRRAPWLGDRGWYSQREMEVAIREGIFEVDMKTLGEADSEMPDRFFFKDKKEPSQSAKAKFHEVVEVFTSYDVDKDGYDEEVITYYHRGSKKLIKTVYNWLNEKRRPYVIYCPEEREDSILGVGMAYRLEGLQRARSAILNQRLDAASRANELLLLVKKGSDLMGKFKRNRLRTGMYETTADLSPQSGDIREIKVSQPFNQLPELEKQIEDESFQIASLSPLNFGFEPTERPTAFGQQAMLAESQFPTNMLVDDFREAMGEIAQTMLSRYVQFWPDGLPAFQSEASPAEQEAMLQMIRWPKGSVTENVKVKCYVSSATLNRDQRRQEKLALIDKLPQVYEFMMTLANAAATPQPVSLAAQQLLKSYTEVVVTWLSDTETSEELMTPPDVTEAVNAGRTLFEMVQQLQQQIQMLMPGMQQGSSPMAGQQPGSPGAQP
jgi:hypothetical protein